ncbi:hypothetical protein K7432_003075 [Basidiobolus ranarum]|uniref:Phosphatidylglycerol/phosphatidylinositol transfer protein n=1 Tax=Basidiobolus ranarum TaxID=34480 RepID=A0ABR2W768_9FUNG
MSTRSSHFHRYSLFCLLYFVFAFYIFSTEAKTAFTKISRCGRINQSWIPITGTSELDAVKRTLDISVIGATDSLPLKGRVNPESPFNASAVFFGSMADISILKFQEFQLCEELGGCPVEGPRNVTFTKHLNLPKFVPFVDIRIMTYLLDEVAGEYGCFELVRDQTDQPYFYILVIAVFCSILLSVLMQFVGYVLGEARNIFVFSSKFGMTGDIQGLQYPGFVDMVYYLQFVVVTALLNLDYPYFYQSFISDFHSIMFVLGDEVTNHAARKARGLANVPVPMYSPEQHGLEFFAHYIGLEAGDLFISLLILMAMVLICVFVVSIIVTYVGSLVKTRTDGSPYSRKKHIAFVAGNVLRVLLLFHLPLTLFAFYQLYTHKTTWVTAVAAVVLVILSFGVIGAILGHMLRIAPQSIIFIDAFYMLLYGPLYNNYTSETCRFAFVDVGYRLILAAIIGLGQGSGLVQLILILCLEVGNFYAIVGTHPWISLPVNRWEICRQAMKILLVSLLFAFLPSVNANNTAKAWCGLVMIFLMIFFQLVWIVKILWNIVVMILRKYLNRRVNNPVPEPTKPGKMYSRPASIASNNPPPTTRTEPTNSLDYSNDGVRYSGFNDSHSYNSQDKSQLSPYEKYMANLRENAGLRHSFAMEDSNGNRPYAYQDSDPSQSSFALDEYPHREVPTQQVKLPKFFSAKNND